MMYKCKYYATCRNYEHEGLFCTWIWRFCREYRQREAEADMDKRFIKKAIKGGKTIDDKI